MVADDAEPDAASVVTCGRPPGPARGCSRRRRPRPPGEPDGDEDEQQERDGAGGALGDGPEVRQPVRRPATAGRRSPARTARRTPAGARRRCCRRTTGMLPRPRIIAASASAGGYCRMLGALLTVRHRAAAAGGAVAAGAVQAEEVAARRDLRGPGVRDRRAPAATNSATASTSWSLEHPGEGGHADAALDDHGRDEAGEGGRRRAAGRRGPRRGRRGSRSSSPRTRARRCRAGTWTTAPAAAWPPA